jgi:hypothetical protein
MKGGISVTESRWQTMVTMRRFTIIFPNTYVKPAMGTYVAHAVLVLVSLKRVVRKRAVVTVVGDTIAVRVSAVADTRLGCNATDACMTWYNCRRCK